MIFESFYSSSAANLYRVTAENGKQLLLECGVPWAKFQKALGYKLDKIEGCVVTHEHADHCKAVEDVLAAGIDIWASEGTLKAIEESLHLHRRAHVLEDRRAVKISETFTVFPFEVHHDCTQPLGFIVGEHQGVWEHRIGHPDRPIASERLLFATDTSYLTQRFAANFNIIALSCNYDRKILQARVDARTIEESVAKRLLSSHMEWHDTQRYLEEFCNLTDCREIHLLHPSEHNIDKETVRKEIEDRFFIKTFIGRDTRAGP